MPEDGIEGFNDLPRYAMGYASLFNAMSFTTETHMLKPFPQRVEATYVFLCSTITWMLENTDAIELARKEAVEWDANLNYFFYNYALTNDSTELLFKGFEHSYPISAVTGEKRLKYHRDKPYEKNVPYFNVFEAKDSIKIPPYIYIGGQSIEVIERLKANNVELKVIEDDETVFVGKHKIPAFESGNSPYEGHYLHRNVEFELQPGYQIFKKGDVIIPMGQENRRFIMSVLTPDAPDSYFAWNYFDSYVQQKEYFSSYVFEDVAAKMLEKDDHLRKEFQIKKETDQEFRESTWMQLYFLYQKSPFYEPTHNVLPVAFIAPLEIKE